MANPRQRYPKLAPLSTTEKFLRELDAYLATRKNRKASAKSLLGCSSATATRLISRRVPRYNRRVRLEWVHRLCNAVGKPYTAFVGAACRDYRQVLNGWAGFVPGRGAMRAATDMALSISMWAAENYQLHGCYTLSYEGLRPISLTLELSPAPHLSAIGSNFGLHRVLIYEDSRVKKMQLNYQPPTGPVVYQRDLSAETLEYILKQIYVSTKNQTAHLARRA